MLMFFKLIFSFCMHDTGDDDDDDDDNNNDDDDESSYSFLI